MGGRKFVVLSFYAWLLAFGCGTEAPTASICTEGERSQPGGTADRPDPCPQTGTECADDQRTASSICSAAGSWLECTCDPPADAGTCGNGTKEGAEECDGDDLGGAVCGDLITGTVGALSCAAVTCSYDTSLCTTDLGVSGTGGGGQGG